MFFGLLLFLRTVKCWKTRGKEYGDDAKLCHQPNRQNLRTLPQLQLPAPYPTHTPFQNAKASHPNHHHPSHPLKIPPRLVSLLQGARRGSLCRRKSDNALCSLKSLLTVTSAGPPDPTRHRRLKMVSRDSFVGARRANF